LNLFEGQRTREVDHARRNVHREDLFFNDLAGRQSRPAGDIGIRMLASCMVRLSTIPCSPSSSPLSAHEDDDRVFKLPGL
jgi:hypothetical protein